MMKDKIHEFLYRVNKFILTLKGRSFTVGHQSPLSAFLSHARRFIKPLLVISILLLTLLSTLALINHYALKTDTLKSFPKVTAFAYKIKNNLPDFSFFSDDKTDEIKKEAVIEDTSDIEISQAKMKEVSDKIEILGQIVFKEKVNISSKINGRLEKINIHEGKEVARGDLLAQIEKLPLLIQLKQHQSDLNIARKSFELTKAKYENALKAIEIKLKTIEKAQADLNDKKVTYENMERILNNKTILFKAGGVSESELQTIKTQHMTLFTKYQLALTDYEIQSVGYRDKDIAENGYRVPESQKRKIEILKKINTKIERAELEAARARISQAKNNIQSTELLLKETTIRSPIDGVVASKNMEAGEMINEDSIIGTLINISKVYIAMNVNEGDIKHINKNQKVQFTVDAIDNKVFTAEINTISPLLDMKTRTVEVKAMLDNPDQRLLPGMFTRATIIYGDNEKKLIIPRSCLAKTEQNNATVYILKKEIVFKQNIEVGKEYGNEIEVVNGLHENDMVISKGINIVYEGMGLKKGSGSNNYKIAR